MLHLFFLSASRPLLLLLTMKPMLQQPLLRYSVHRCHSVLLSPTPPPTPTPPHCTPLPDSLHPARAATARRCFMLYCKCCAVAVGFSVQRAPCGSNSFGLSFSERPAAASASAFSERLAAASASAFSMRLCGSNSFGFSVQRAPVRQQQLQLQLSACACAAATASASVFSSSFSSFSVSDCTARTSAAAAASQASASATALRARQQRQQLLKLQRQR